jgi:hypothetical protein
MRRTRAACVANDRKPVWAILEGRILLPVTAGTAPVPHGDLARRLGLQDAAQSASFLASGKQLFIQVFRMVVREYMAASQRDDEPGEALDRAIDEELRDLWAIFAARPH